MRKPLFVGLLTLLLGACGSSDGTPDGRDGGPPPGMMRLSGAVEKGPSSSAPR
jgi:hypothetical protein